MCRHRDTHEEGHFVKWYTKKVGGEYKDVWRPAEHFWNHKREAVFVENRFELDFVLPPEGAKLDEEKGEMICTLCDKVVAKWDMMWNENLIGGAITKYNNHRKICEHDVELETGVKMEEEEKVDDL